MAASIDGHDGLGCIAFDERLCEIEATCVTGFEDIVKADIEERLGVKVVPIQGKVFVFIPFKDVEKVCIGHRIKVSQRCIVHATSNPEYINKAIIIINSGLICLAPYPRMTFQILQVLQCFSSKSDKVFEL